MIPIRTLTALAAATLLAACSQLPLPANVDLRARMGADAEGRVATPVEAAPVQDVEATLPEPDGRRCVAIPAQKIPVTVYGATLHWNVDVRYDGPELTGRVQARLYVAGPDEELFHPSHALGPTLTLNLDRTKTRLAGSATLSPEQLAAVNDRTVCWGVRVRGEDVGADEAGTATVDYEVHDLWLKLRFGVV